MIFRQKLNNIDGIENISVKEKFIFVHIPKNAGTSIYKALGINNTNHHTAKEYSNLLGKEYSKYFTFAFARHPLDRFISLYNYARMEESYYHSSINPALAKHGKHMDYDVLKDKNIQECAELLIENKLRHDSSWNQWLPQTTWMLNDNDEIIINYIGKVEDLPLHIRNISQIIHRKIDVLTINASTKRSIKTHSDLGKDTIRILQKYYQKDFELLNY